MNTKFLVFKAILRGFILGIGLYAVLAPQVSDAATLVKDGHLTICKLDNASYNVVKSLKVTLTGYSSTPDQTDDTPFITASGKHVADGILAINGLAFGTLVKIPKLYGDKIFVVEDRMNTKYGQLKRADIWFADRDTAVQFGVKYAEIQIVES